MDAPKRASHRRKKSWLGSLLSIPRDVEEEEECRESDEDGKRDRKSSVDELLASADDFVLIASADSEDGPSREGSSPSLSAIAR